MQVLWPYARTVWGWLAFAYTALLTALALYYAPKKMFETWRWYMNEFRDPAIRDHLSRSVTSPKLTMAGEKRWAIPQSVPEIANALGWSERRVRASLTRLKRRGEVEETTDGKWRWILK